MNVRSAAPPRLALSIEAGGREKAETRPLVDLVARRRREHGQRRLKVQGLRLLVAAGVLGGWQLGAPVGDCNRTGLLCLVDTVFWSQPSHIAQQHGTWLPQRTDLRPIWDPVLLTLED